MCKQKVFIHTTATGEKIPLTSMSDQHLINTIRYLKRCAHEGIIIQSGGGDCPEDFWYDEDIIYGDEALKHVHYDVYVKELSRRKISIDLASDRNFVSVS